MDDEPRRGHLASTMPTVPTAPDASPSGAELTVRAPSPAVPLLSAPAAQASHGLRDRATAGAASLGAAALLVLSFGPAALALSPSGTTSVPPQGRSWIAPLEVGTVTAAAEAPSRNGQAP